MSYEFIFSALSIFNYIGIFHDDIAICHNNDPAYMLHNRKEAICVEGLKRNVIW